MKETIKKEWLDFQKKNNKVPNVAFVTTKWNDNGEESDVTIVIDKAHGACRFEDGEQLNYIDDDSVFYYCSTLEEFLSLVDGVEDFKVVKFSGFACYEDDGNCDNTERHTYSVCRTYSVTKYATIEATSKEEAIALAKKLNESEWEEDQFQDYYEPEYIADLED